MVYEQRALVSPAAAMDSQGFHFVELAIGGSHNRNQVVRVDDVPSILAAANGSSNCFRTYCRFSVELLRYAETHASSKTGKPLSVAGYDGPALATFLPFDFDHKENPEKALEDACTLVRRVAALSAGHPAAPSFVAIASAVACCHRLVCVLALSFVFIAPVEKGTCMSYGSTGSSDWIIDVRNAGVPVVAELLGGVVVDRNGRGLRPCPGCGDHQRGYSSRDTRGPVGISPDGLGWRCWRCGIHGDPVSLAALIVVGTIRPRADQWSAVRRACADVGLCSENGSSIAGNRRSAMLETFHRRREEQASAEVRRRQQRVRDARHLWRSARPASGSLVENYLRSRALYLAPPPCSLRFAEALFHHPTGKAFPAMVAAVRDVTGRVVAVHETFLAPDGMCKAAVAKPRLMVGPVSGGAVRFGDGRELIITEGVENALSAVQACQLPAYAALSATGIRLLIMPPYVRRVTVFADGDDDAERRVAPACRVCRDPRCRRAV
jgi:hypothetical protein